MSDIDSLIDAIYGMTNAVSKNTTGQGSVSLKDNPEKAAGILSSSMGIATKSLIEFNSETSSVTTEVNRFSSNISKIPLIGVAVSALGVGTAMGILAGATQKLYDSWVDLYKVGAVDGMTGLTELGKIASDSYQSLEEFTNSARESAKVVAELGLKGFSELQTDVRLAAREFGSFGMQISEQNEALGEFLEVQRTLGTIENINRGQAISDFINLSSATSALAHATGRSRDQIAKQTAENMKNNTSLYGFLNTLPSGIKQSVTASAQGAMSVFASLGEQTGGDLNKILSGTLATGSAGLANGMAEIQAFIPGVVRGFDGLQGAIRSGDLEAAQEGAIGVVEEIKKMGPAQAQQLAMLAERGNQAAQQILAMSQSAETFNSDQLRRSIRDKEQFTSTNQFFGNFNQNMKVITSQLRRVFFAVLEPIMASFGSSDTDAFSDFTDSVRIFVDDNIIPMSERLGEWLADDGIPKAMGKIADWYDGLFEGVAGTDPGKKFTNWIDGIFASADGKAATGILNGLGNMFENIGIKLKEIFFGSTKEIEGVMKTLPGVFGDPGDWEAIKKYVSGFIEGIKNTFASFGELTKEDVAKKISEVINSVITAFAAFPEFIDNFIASFIGSKFFSDETVEDAEKRIKDRAIAKLEAETTDILNNPKTDPKSKYNLEMKEQERVKTDVSNRDSGGWFSLPTKPEEQRGPTIQDSLQKMIAARQDGGLDSNELKEIKAAIAKLGVPLEKANDAMQYLASVKPGELNAATAAVELNGRILRVARE